MLISQAATQNNPTIYEVVKECVGLAVTIIGGICALKGIGYIESLRETKALSTFTFGSQLYARICEMSNLISETDLLFTNLFSEDACKEWPDKRCAPKEELCLLYDSAKETLEFIKNAPNQMPAYENWGKDYRALIQILVDIVHYDIRTSQKGFKFTTVCAMDSRKAYRDKFMDLLKTISLGLETDQNEKSEELFC